MPYITLECSFYFPDKYKDHLERVRRDRSQPTSPSNLSNGLASIERSQQGLYGQSESSILDQSWSSAQDESRPSSSVPFQNGTSRSPLPLSNSRSLSRYTQGTQRDDTPEDGYFEGPVERRIDQSWSSINDQSRSSSSVAFQNGSSGSPLPLANSRSLSKYRQGTQRDDTPEAGYFEGPAETRSSEIHRSPDLVSASRKFIFSMLFVHLALDIYMLWFKLFLV